MQQNHTFSTILSRLISLIVLVLVIAACGTAAPPAAEDTAPTTPADTPEPAAGDAPSANITKGCVETYDPNVDYFPEQASLTHAEGWTIEYFNNYKVINVLTPWRDADVTFQYVLVQCGTPAPEGFDDAQIIEVPINTIVTMSTTHLPHLQELDLLDRLVGVDSAQFVNTPEVVAMAEAGDLVEIGSGAEVNVERVIDLEPDVIMAFGSGDPQNDAHPQLLEVGLTVAINAGYVESSPLGRSEWIKFTSALFNREAAAETVFADMTSAYNELAAQASAVTERPTVFTNAPFQGTWFVSGGNSYLARLLSDAGADYVWADDDSTTSQELSFEVVFDRAADADFWVNTSSWASIDEALAVDERFGDFAALQNGQIYNNNARLNENGGNDYWESGVANPHLILADLIKIFHPDLLPEHELYFYQQLQ